MPCLDPQRLKRLFLGQVPLGDDEAARLEQHLTECPRCDEIAAAAASEDPLRHALQEDLPVGPAAAALLARFKTTCLTTGTRLTAARENGLDGQEAEFLSPPEQAGEIGRLGPYRILSVLGAGGMGIVFRAHDLRLNSERALKVMRPRVAQRAEARKLFLQEAQAAANLRSDHIVPVYFVDEINSIPWLAMPVLEGETLEARLRRGDLSPRPCFGGEGPEVSPRPRFGGEGPGVRGHGRLPLPEILSIAREATQALAAAHEQGVIHRDVKPANIWLEDHAPAPCGYRVKLLDFGIARAAQSDPELHALTARAGTPSYMAPEQALGHADPRSDLYSLGCVLYELCTGRLPTYGGTMARSSRPRLPPRTRARKQRGARLSTFIQPIASLPKA